MTKLALQESQQSRDHRAGAWKLEPGRALTLHPTEAGELRVAEGRLWATLDGPHALLVVARAVKEGRFRAAVMPLGIKDGVVDFVINPRMSSRISPALAERIRAARDSIVNGTLHVPHVEIAH